MAREAGQCWQQKLLLLSLAEVVATKTCCSVLVATCCTVLQHRWTTCLLCQPGCEHRQQNLLPGRAKIV